MDLLKNELTKLVYDYSIKRKYADGRFIDKVVALCINEFDINDYVRKCETMPIEDKYTYAGYSIETRKITIDISSCIISAIDRIESEKKQNIKSSEFLKYVKVNLNLINGIIHELAHAYQYKKCIEGEDSLEKRILELTLDRNIRVLNDEKLSLKEIAYYKALDVISHDDLYYTATPSERMANLKGLEFENDISLLLPSKEKDNLDYYTELRLLLGQMQAYRDASPTAFIDYVNEMMKEKYGLPSGKKDMKEVEKFYNRLAIENNLSLNERIFLGLPIDKVDRNKIDKKINKLYKHVMK